VSSSSVVFHTSVAQEGASPTFRDCALDGWHVRVTAAGARADGAPRENPRYGIYHFFFFSDPDGHRLEVQRFLDPRWDRAGG
jgi:catechol 2,3-dioxygenase-like lactoylglutathione lyase family enzyme